MVYLMEQYVRMGSTILQHVCTTMCMGSTILQHVCTTYASIAVKSWRDRDATRGAVSEFRAAYRHTRCPRHAADVTPAGAVLTAPAKKRTECV